MTFEDTLEIKNRFGKVIIYQNKEWLLKIVPNNSDDLIKYFLDLSSKYISDQDAKSYSHNQDFTIHRFLISFFELQHEELNF